MIYVRINKAGSTSVTNFVKDQCNILQLNKYKVGRRVDRLAGWLDREGIKKQTCFTVTRNPFTRAVSCWQHCLRLKLGYDAYTFEQWLEKDFTEMHPEERAHSLRQVDFLLDTTGSIKWIDKIFKLEDPGLEIKLNRLIGTTDRKLEHMAKGEYRQRDYYTPYAKQLVRDKYYLDFRFLGYDSKELDK